MNNKLGRIVAIDYGLKRVGIAVTDPLQLIAQPLTTLPTSAWLLFLTDFLKQEVVVAFVMGNPQRWSVSSMTHLIAQAADQLQKRFPRQALYYQDERFTSKLAAQGLYQAGYRKKDRRCKDNIDKVSAAIILQSFLYKFHQLEE